MTDQPVLGKFGLGQQGLARVGKFLVVGGIGALVNSLALVILYQVARLPLVVASALAAELAISHNFALNHRWTFRGTRASLGRFAQFNLVSLGGLVINTSILWALERYAGLPYLIANLMGIALATSWNVTVNTLWTWGGVL